ncbi:response regulator [Rugamonas sp. FT81W]|uniref:histidine kinase n=2 Tax=Duganella vulcania TaxID=2692166 RepID=A0A845GEU2_9BURK|nr:response regulator [Duganella vulcania]
MGPAVGGGTTILYVDDEEMARKYFTRALSDDHAVLTANGVDQALAILATPGHSIGVLVTDYRMPGQSGGILLRHVTEHYPQLVCMLVTAYADKEVLLDSINGADVFRVLEKPLELTQLRHALRLAVNRALERQTRLANLEAIEEATAFLAQELNTPLNTVLEMARKIERYAQPGGEIAPAATRAHDNARYCLQVLTSFVKTVRVAHGSMATRGVQTVRSAVQVVDALLDTYPLQSAQRKMMRVELREDFPITASTNSVSLVLSSVLGNALRALEGRADGEIQIAILVEGVPRILIRDNGTGIAPEIMGQLLVNPVTTHAESGATGWGLIFCQRLMQSIGGNLLVESEAGLSSTVTLMFPAIS